MATRPEILDLYERYRASMTRAVFCRRVEVLCGYAAIALPYAAKVPGWGHGRRYLVLLGLFVGAVALLARMRGMRERFRGAKCKQFVIRGYGYGDPLPPQATADLLEEVPLIGRLLQRFQKPKPIDEYYTCSQPEGAGRVLEMYAESAFFSARILAFYALVLACVCVALTAFAVFGLFTAAIEIGNRPAVWDQVAEVLLSSLVVNIVMTTAQRAYEAHVAAGNVRQIESALLAMSLAAPPRDEIDQRARAYEAEVGAAPLVSSVIYNARNGALTKLWDQRKALIWNVAPKGAPAPGAQPLPTP
jgi:hypothetical protein